MTVIPFPFCGVKMFNALVYFKMSHHLHIPGSKSTESGTNSYLHFFGCSCCCYYRIMKIEDQSDMDQNETGTKESKLLVKKLFFSEEYGREHTLHKLSQKRK